MDEFLSDIYFSVFREWVKQKFSGECKEEGSDIIVDAPCYRIRMGFNELNIIEFEITNKKNDEVEFYLHFQMQNLHHAVNLFDQMMETVKGMAEDQHFNILLSCTGGLTTSYFAEELNQMAQTLHKDYHFDAVAYSDVVEAGDRYDLILLAPQIAYQRPKLQAVFRNKPIRDIPATLFAKYDTAGTIEFVEKEIGKKQDVKNTEIECQCDIDNKNIVLVLACFRHRHNIVMEYSIYDHNEVLSGAHQRIIKKSIDLEDFYDIFDTVFSKYPKVKNVSIAMPGMVDDDGLVTGTFHSISVWGVNYVRVFNKKYPDIKFKIFNDSNAAAVGLSILHPEYDDILMYLLGKNNSVGGMGLVINRRLVFGKQGIAGELRWWKKDQDRVKEYIERAKTVEGTVAIVAENLLPAISIVGPQMVGIASDLVPYVSEVKDILKRHIPEKYLPDFIKVENTTLCMMIGAVELFND